MKTARTLLLGAATLLCLTAALTAHAQQKMYQGRTGLPTVKEGSEKVWIERGDVNLDVRGSNLYVTQDFRLHYPGGKLEKGRDHSRVAVREDFFRSTDNHVPHVTPADAKGFTSFAVWIDGRRVRPMADDWRINDNKDTATRWRSWWITFSPGRVHTMRIVSVAPLGWEGHSRTVQFVSKDLGHWRDLPDNLEIRFHAPARAGAHLAGLEPKPDGMSRTTLNWEYRKVQPKRDIYILLPSDYPSRSAMR
jgi:hypothetical protein